MINTLVTKVRLLPHQVGSLHSPHKPRDDGAWLVCVAVSGESMGNTDVVSVDVNASLLCQLDHLLDGVLVVGLGKAMDFHVTFIH